MIFPLQKRKATRRIRQERLTELYHLARLGKLSSGLFHDLMNPLSAMVHIIEQIDHHPDNIPLAKEHLENAVATSKRVRSFLQAVSKQLTTKHSQEIFSPAKEIQDAITILQYRNREIHSATIIELDEAINLFGNPIAFLQIALNLIANAIDACEGILPSPSIHITLRQTQEEILFSVCDNGCGIPDTIGDKIFTAFFTTKTRGTGLGLSITKNLVEHEFGGTIEAFSCPDNGTKLTVSIPHTSQETALTNALHKQ